MADRPQSDETEVEIVCPNCGYRLARSVARLRRDTELLCPNCGRRLTHDRGPADGQ